MYFRGKISLVLVLVSLLLAITVWPAVAQVTSQLTMHSQPGDYIGQGLDYSYDTSTGVFSANVLTSDGKVDFTTISYQDASDWWFLDFSSRGLGVPLTPGTYPNAQRAAFADPGHPGLDVFGNGRGCNTLTGSFTVEQAVFDYSGDEPQVRSFIAEFEQHCEGALPALFGRIEYYNWKQTYLPLIHTEIKEKMVLASQD